MQIHTLAMLGDNWTMNLNMKIHFTHTFYTISQVCVSWKKFRGMKAIVHRSRTVSVNHIGRFLCSRTMCSQWKVVNIDQGHMRHTHISFTLMAVGQSMLYFTCSNFYFIPSITTCLLMTWNPFKTLPVTSLRTLCVPVLWPTGFLLSVTCWIFDLWQVEERSGCSELSDCRTGGLQRAAPTQLAPVKGP